MARRAETTSKPQNGWGRARRVAQSSILAFSLVAGATALSAEPLEADATRSNPTTPVSVARTVGETAVAHEPSTPQMSVSAFSAAQSSAARILLAQELNGESNRAVGTVPFSAAPQSGSARVGEAQVREEEAAEAAAGASEESLIVGRSLRAYTRSQEDVEVSAPRRRAAFSSAISRAAAAGALTSTNPNASVSNALSSARFTPAQNSGQFDPGFSQAAEVLTAVPGLRLQSATLFGGYSSNSLPQGLGSSVNMLRGTQLGADYDLGASALISYSRQGRRSSTTLNYTPSHVQRSRVPEWSTTDHRMSFRTSHDLTPRLSWQTNANLGNSGLEQFWLRPAVFRAVEVPASFNELMQRVQSGEISDDEFAAILTGSPVVEDPGGSVRALSRILSVSVGTSASYSHSRRLTFNFGGATSANRLLGGDLEAPARSGSRYLRYARSTRGNVSADYRLSSRTSFQFSHMTVLTDSTLIRSTSQNPSASVSQILSRHWRYQIGGGIGTIRFQEGSRSRYTLDNATTWTAHGSLGYSMDGHNISLSGSKRVGDPMGFGSRSTVQAGLHWNWQPRFSPWGADAGVGFSSSDFGGGQFTRNFSSELYSAGITRRLTPSTSFRSEYFFGEYVTPFSGVTSNMSVHRVQMSLMWRPVEPR